VITVKEEKNMECKHCPVHCGEGYLYGGKAHLFLLVGTLALVYGVVNYLRMAYYWPPYAGWIVGGIVLILIGMAKKYWMMNKSEG
jgi:hypothetical protein